MLSSIEALSVVIGRFDRELSHAVAGFKSLLPPLRGLRKDDLIKAVGEYVKKADADPKVVQVYNRFCQVRFNRAVLSRIRAEEIQIARLFSRGVKRGRS